MTDSNDAPRMLIPIPGGRTARVPMSVLEQYVDGNAQPAHAVRSPVPAAEVPAAAPAATSAPASVVINIFTNGSQVAVERTAHGVSVSAAADSDVVAHSLSTDPITGASVWHTDWEYGECVVTDDYGFPRVENAWHRHPLATDYAEIMR